MASVSDAAVATIIAGVVTLALPCFLYGAWIILDAERRTWEVLVRHLTFVVTGLALTTVPMVVWMVPRLFGLGPHPGQLGGFAVLHGVVGMFAYAMLLFGLTGIVRVFRAKYEHDLYHDYDEEVLLAEIGGEKMDHWRSRIRIGVFGYVVFWLIAWFIGLFRWTTRYVL